MSDSDVIMVSRADLREIVRAAVRDELRAVGLRTDDVEHSEAVRDDLKFAGRLRKTVEGFASKIGLAIVLAVVGGVIYLLQLGATHLLKG
jgi:hypothetical protein